MCAIGDSLADFAEVIFHPSVAPLRENFVKVAFKQRAGVLEILFGVRFGGGDALKRFVQNADDPLLLGERGDIDREVRQCGS